MGTLIEVEVRIFVQAVWRLVCGGDIWTLLLGIMEAVGGKKSRASESGCCDTKMNRRNGDVNVSARSCH